MLYHLAIKLALGNLERETINLICERWKNVCKTPGFKKEIPAKIRDQLKQIKNERGKNSEKEKKNKEKGKEKKEKGLQPFVVVFND